MHGGNIHAVLAAYGPLTAQVSTYENQPSIFLSRAPERVEYPYIIIRDVSREALDGGKAGWLGTCDVAIYARTSYALTANIAQVVADALRTAGFEMKNLRPSPPEPGVEGIIIEVSNYTR